MVLNQFVTGRHRVHIKMVLITNVVVQADLQASIDLRHLANWTRDICYNPGKFSGAIWQHRIIGGNCLVFSNGKLCCNGNKTIPEARRRLRQYSRLIQRLGVPVKLHAIKVITMSAVHQLSGRLDLSQVCTTSGASYDPEFFNAAMMKRGRMHFNCFHTGKVVITGIRRMRDLDEVIYPAILELELCIS